MDRGLCRAHHRPGVHGVLSALLSTFEDTITVEPRSSPSLYEANTMKSNRRIFLKSMGAGAAAFMLTALPSRDVAAAAALEDQHFVFCYFGGGWDILMSLDPRDWAHSSYSALDVGWDQVDWTGSADITAAGLSDLESLHGQVRPSGSNIDFGPLFYSLLMDGTEDYSSLYEKGSIVRGISMDTLTHEVGRRYFITGKPPAGTRAVGSTLTAEMMAQLDPDKLPLLSNLAVRVEAYADGLPFYANPARLTDQNDLVRLLRRDNAALSGSVADEIKRYRSRARFDDAAHHDRLGLMALIRASQEDAEELIESGLSQDFATAKLQAAGVGFDTRLIGERNAAITYQALTKGLAHCANISVTPSLDTHFDNWIDDQPANQLQGWRAVAKLMRSLENTTYKNTGDNWLDHTTIVCFSEFARTAKINARGGRDHNLVNAAYMVGAMAPQNKVIGGTDPDTMNPLRIHPDTGALSTSSSGIVLTPKILYASLLRNAGFNTDGFRNVEIDALRQG